MDIIYEIRRRRNMQKQSISAIARETGLSRPTVRKHLATVEEPKYERVQPISPKLGQFAAHHTRWLEQEVILSKPRRRSAQRLFEGLQEMGYAGAYDSLQRYVKHWKSANLQTCKPANHSPKLKDVFVPLLFKAGDACQFDWSQEQVEIGGYCRTLKLPTSALRTAARCLWLPILAKFRRS